MELLVNGAKNNYLYKDSLYKYSKEPIAEVICSDILDVIGLNHIKYTLVRSEFNSISDVVSKCKIEDNVVEVSKLIDNKLIDDDEDNKILIELVNLSKLEDVLSLFVFDAVVLNPDRRYSNIHFKNKSMIILDNGQALQSMNGFEVMPNHNRCMPFRPFHDEQLEFIIDTLIEEYGVGIKEDIINTVRKILDIDMNVIREIVNKYKTFIGEVRINNVIEMMKENIRIVNRIINNVQYKNEDIEWIR